jgi:hypothetical protein
MMTGQPSRVTPAEISAFLDHLHRLQQLGRRPSLDELIAFHEHKVAVLSRIATQMDDAYSRREANRARDYLQFLTEFRDGHSEAGDRR